MTKLFISLLLTVVTISVSYSQVDFATMEKELAYHADIMVNTTVAEHRFKAAKLFENQFVTMLNTAGSYDQKLESLKWISQLKSGDNKFRIFSWIVADQNGLSTTYGYIQFADGSLVQLEDNGEISTDLEYEQTDANSWFGAIYYHIMPFTNGGKTDYILFGYRQIAKFDKVKVLDVLSLEGNQITFGKELFIKEVEGARDDIKTRLVITYSADANVSIHYNENMGMIVHDHLISRMGRIKGQGPTQVPDGSMVGYKQEVDSWVYVDKLFNQTSETAPRPQPVLGGDRNKNIFGKSGSAKKKKRN